MTHTPGLDSPTQQPFHEWVGIIELILRILRHRYSILLDIDLGDTEVLARYQRGHGMQQKGESTVTRNESQRRKLNAPWKIKLSRSGLETFRGAICRSSREPPSVLARSSIYPRRQCLFRRNGKMIILQYLYSTKTSFTYTTPTVI